jgi:iron complex transport system substrate-binding protein
MRISAILLVLLAAIPVLGAADATDYVLGIYGNANMDGVVDQKDMDYVRGIINGTNPQTQLSDAFKDRAIDEKDIKQIEQIISGTETNLTLLDSKNDTVSINMPLQRVVSLSDDSVELLRSIGSQGSIVGVESRVNDNKPFFGDISGLPSVGKWNDPDLEAILKLQPDAIICYTEYPSKDKLEAKLSKNIPVMRFECDDPDKIERETAELGYIFNRRNESENLIDFYDGITSTIAARVSGLK